MKKSLFYFAFTLILMLSFSILSNGQNNLAVNGDLEVWTAGAPDGWNLTENISQESTIVNGGSFSAKHTSSDVGSQKFQQIVSGIQAGQDYTISYSYYDDDAQAKTRIWSYWLSGTSTLPDNGDILRPGEYSENNAGWQDFSEILNAPAGADGFRFEVRVYHQDNLTGGAVYYDDFSVSGDIVVDPEPTNYATDFEAIASSGAASVDVFWSDAVGAQLPSAYVILASTSSTLPVPVDGTPIPDDTDFSDGSGALNISYETEECSFNFLDPNTPYYFTIYSYTNNGALIDYKNDGTAPTANAITANIAIIESENFDESWGNWTTISMVGAQAWNRDNTYGIGSTPCAAMTGYDGAPFENDDWLISPALNLDEYESEVLVFYNALGYTGPDLQLKISTDYDGGGDPTTATWTTESFTFSTGFFEWTESGNIDLSVYDGNAVYVAFHFTSTNSESATWEVDNVLITGIGDIVIDPEPSNYPTNFDASWVSGTDITLFWDDAVGTQLPSNYLIYAGTSASLPTPVDGMPVPNDTDLSDGSGALNVGFEIEETMFEDLMQGTTYYFSIYSYTNAGVNIDYKNDGTAPTAMEEIPAAPEPANYPTSFMADATTSMINLMWTDATGNPLPEAYIIYANTDEGSLPTPADGTPVDDDTDLSDGSGAINVSYGMEATMFDNLEQGMTYYFSIYPYSNSGSNIDYKNDGTAPSAMATTLEILEPSNYPTSFEATAASTSIDLTWMDATGDQLPEAYIIYAGITPGLPMPADGTPVPDDLDLSDGSGAVNIDFGVEMLTLSSLEANTTYYFSIYPYVGSESEINYKNDGTAPAAEATTEEANMMIIESENFDVSWGNWTTISVVGAQMWDRNNTWGVGDTPCASMTGYDGAAFENDDWLISPALDLDSYNNEILVFKNALGYTGPDLQLKISNDYDGGGDPYSATWSTETFTISAGFFEWTESGNIDLSGYEGSAVYVAFQFTSTSTESATWEIDDIVISGEENLSSDDQFFADDLFKVYPNPTTGMIYFERSGTEYTNINIMSATGQVVKSISSNAELTKIDLTDFNKGLYIISLNNKVTGQTITRKLILR